MVRSDTFTCPILYGASTSDGTLVPVRPLCPNAIHWKHIGNVYTYVYKQRDLSLLEEFSVNVFLRKEQIRFTFKLQLVEIKVNWRNYLGTIWGSNSRFHWKLLDSLVRQNTDHRTHVNVSAFHSHTSHYNLTMLSITAIHQRLQNNHPDKICDSLSIQRWKGMETFEGKWKSAYKSEDLFETNAKIQAGQCYKDTPDNPGHFAV